MWGLVIFAVSKPNQYKMTDQEEESKSFKKLILWFPFLTFISLITFVSIHYVTKAKLQITKVSISSTMEITTTSETTEEITTKYIGDCKLTI